MRLGNFGKQKGYCIYALLNPINDKVYIGMSKDVDKRWADKGIMYRGCTLIYNAIQKYGWDTFHHIVLFDELTFEEAQKREKEWIKFFKANNKSYNLSDGGEGVTGVSHGMRKVYCYNLSGILVGEYDSIKDSIECLLKVPYKSCNGSVANVLSGRKYSYKGFVWSYSLLDVSYFHKPYKIFRLNKDNTLSKIYNSWKEVKKDFPDIRNICSCIGGSKKTSNGYKWKKVYETD